jgi:hypothetical protein
MSINDTPRPALLKQALAALTALGWTVAARWIALHREA